MEIEEKIWWEELADQYEEWAENPPRAVLSGSHERHTCTELVFSDFGWGHCGTPGDCLLWVWVWQYGDTECPAGHTYDKDRDEKRFEFCHYMAEAIRDYLETGRGPWE